MERVGLALPALFIRLDDSTLCDIADGRSDNGVPPKGLAVRFGERRLLLQAEGAGPLRPPEGPLLIELDRRSDGDADLPRFVGPSRPTTHSSAA